MLFGLRSLPKSIHTLSKNIKKGESDETIWTNDGNGGGVFGVCGWGMGWAKALCGELWT
jgi:hypothetical protein